MSKNISVKPWPPFKRSGTTISTRTAGDALSMANQVSWSAGVAVTAAAYSVGRDADGTNQLHFNVPTGAGYEWSTNDVVSMLLGYSSNTTTLSISNPTDGFSVLSFNSGSGAQKGKISSLYTGVMAYYSYTGVAYAEHVFYADTAPQVHIKSSLLFVGNSDGQGATNAFTIRGNSALADTNVAGNTLSIYSAQGSGNANAGVLRLFGWLGKKVSGVGQHEAGLMLAIGNTGATIDETVGKFLDQTAITWNDAVTAAAGTVTNLVFNAIAAPTITATNAVTYTNAATWYIGGAPIASTNATVTNPYSLWVDSGTTRLDGALNVGGALTASSGSTHTFGNNSLSANTTLTIASTGTTTLRMEFGPTIYYYMTRNGSTGLIDLIGQQSGSRGLNVAGQLVCGTADAVPPLTVNDNTTTVFQVLDGGLTLRKVTAGITAGTTQTQGQVPLVANINEVSTCANPNDVVTLPSAVAGMEVTIINNGAETLQIYPASGDNLGAGADTSTTLNAASNVTFAAYDGTNWETV